MAGPIADFQNTPFLVVLGTMSNDTVTKKVLDVKGKMLIGDWKYAQKYEPRVKKDIEVTEEDLKQYSLFLLGGPEENKISKTVCEKILIRITENEIVIDGKSFKAKNALLNMVYPNPFNTERYINLVAATSGTGLNFFNPRQRELFQFDYYIMDGVIPNYSAGAKNEKIMIASGFFNRNWKMDDVFLNKGIDSLRSKCAYTVVHKDLTTTIISTAKPSIEFLKSVAGTYQINGGPQLKIFLVNDMLRIAQGPNDQFSAEMHATSESEFYIKEVYVFLVFTNDAKSNDYIMNGYQNGQEFTSQKIK